MCTSHQVLLGGRRGFSTSRTPVKEAQDAEQYDGANQRYNQAHDTDALVNGTGTEQRANQPTPDQGEGDLPSWEIKNANSPLIDTQKRKHRYNHQ